MNELHLFAGAGGGILGGMLLGHTTVCAVEIEPYARRVLLQRQRDGVLPRFPIWDDVTTFDGTPWRGRVDVLCGGFPCQDISSCGRGEGINGARSGLWGEMARIICEVAPAYVLVENSPNLTSRGLGRVVGDLAEMGYDAAWGVLGADAAGLPHHRARMWLAGYSAGKRREGQGRCEYAVDQTPIRDWETSEFVRAVQGGAVPYLCRDHNGMAAKLERNRAIGNGQVPAVAALAFQTLHARLISALHNDFISHGASEPRTKL